MCPIFEDYDDLLQNVNLVNHSPSPLIAYTSGKWQIAFHYLEDTEQNSLDTIGYDIIDGVESATDATAQSMEYAMFSETSTLQRGMFDLVFGLSSNPGDYSYSVFFNDVVSNLNFFSSSATNATINIGQVGIDYDSDFTADGLPESTTLGYAKDYFNSEIGPDRPDWDYSQSFGSAVHADIWLNSEYALGWGETGLGSAQLSGVLHEVGHALGLAHTHIYDPMTNTNISLSLDNAQYSIMSYVQLGGMEVPGTPSTYQVVRPKGLQVYDIIALQEIFADRNYEIRKDNSEYEAGQGLNLNIDNPFIYTIWDGGGIDIIDASAYADGVKIDLRQGAYSSIGKALDEEFDGLRGEGLVDNNVGIAYYTVIENAKGTSANDLLIGNAWNNTLWGGAGNDIIHGDGSTHDTDGEFIDDDDTLGGTRAEGNEWVDSAEDGSGDDTIYGEGGVDFIYGGAGDDALYGGAGNDHLFGGSGINTLYGGGDDDTFYAGSGTATYYGGDDTADSGTDTVDFSEVDTGIHVSWDYAGETEVRRNGVLTDQLNGIEKIVGTDSYGGYQFFGPSLPIGQFATGSFDAEIDGAGSSDNYYINRLNIDGVKTIRDTGSAGTDTIDVMGRYLGSTYIIDSQYEFWAMGADIAVTGDDVTITRNWYVADITYPEVGRAAYDFSIVPGSSSDEIHFKKSEIETLKFAGFSISTEGLTSFSIAPTQYNISSTDFDFYYRDFQQQILLRGNPASSVPVEPDDDMPINPDPNPANPVYNPDPDQNPSTPPPSDQTPESHTFNRDFGGNFFANDESVVETMHPAVITSFAAGSGYATMTFQTSIQSLGLRLNSEDVWFTASGSLGNASLTIYNTVDSSSYTVTNFEQGTEIEAIGFYSRVHDEAFAGTLDGEVIALGSGQFQGTYDDSVEEPTDDETVNYYLETLYMFDAAYDMLASPTFKGDSQANNITGLNTRNDTLLGLAGDDNLQSHGGNDTLVGGLGNDGMSGGEGNDTYEFSAGDGTDVIGEAEGEGFDTIRIRNIDPEDIRVWSDSYGYLHLTNKSDASDDISIIGDYAIYNTSGERVEQVVFDDETVWDLTAGINFEGTSGADQQYGTIYGDTIRTLGGDDYIDAGAGNDTLIGGAGSDSMAGITGDDTYEFSAGDGTDVIGEAEGEGFDTIRLKNIDPEDIRVWSDSYGYLHLTNKNDASDDISIIGDYAIYNTSGERVEQVVFDDTTVWDLTEGLAFEGTSSGESIYGTALGDTIDALAGADNLNGGSGNDTLKGGSGDDTLSGEDNNDFLWGEDGLDYLYGGSGADIFVFEAANAFNDIDVIGDFSTAQNDAIDINGLLFGYDPLTDAIADFVLIEDSGSDSTVKIDRDGAGTTYGWAQIATISGVTGLTDEAALEANGHLIAA